MSASASSSLNIIGGSLYPGVRRYPPYLPDSDSTGTPRSCSVLTYRRTVRRSTSSRSASSAPVSCERDCSSSRTVRTRVVGCDTQRLKVEQMIH